MFALNFRSIALAGLVGVACLLSGPIATAQDPTDALLAQLKELTRDIAEGQGNRFFIGVAPEAAEKGLTVKQVVPHSPAAKAGVQNEDVITAVQGAPLSKIEQLAKAVAESKGEKLTLQIIRDGKPQEIVVTPENPGRGLMVVGEEEEEESEEDEEGEDEDGEDEDESKKPMTGGGTFFQPRAGHPGAPSAWQALTVHPDARMVNAQPGMQLPDDMEVTVSKKGNRPAIIKVTQGVKSWKTDENEMHMLPPPAQMVAARMLGKPHAMPFPNMMPHPGMMPGAHPQPGNPLMPGPATFGGKGEVRQFQLQLGKDGKPNLQPSTISPQIRQLPGGGIQIEIREGNEKEKLPLKPNPEIKKPAIEKKVEEKKPEAKKPDVKKPEERKPEAKQPETKKPGADKKPGSEKESAPDKKPDEKKADDKKSDEKKPDEMKKRERLKELKKHDESAKPGDSEEKSASDKPKERNY